MRSARLFTRARRRLLAAAVIVAAIVGGLVGAGLVSDPQTIATAEAADSATNPTVYSFIAFNDKIDTTVDELRTSFVLKVPHGYVNPVTGALTAVDGKYLRLAFDYYGAGGGPATLTYLNTMNGADGATAWAKNVGRYYTIHEVIVMGKNDYLVISAEGDMNLNDYPTMVAGGQAGTMNWYFGYSTGSASGPSDLFWYLYSPTVLKVEYHNYSGTTGTSAIQGPIVQVQYDNTGGFWSGGQANWAAVLDFGLNGQPPGVLPANSAAVELINRAYSSTSKGPAASVSTSFWYAWVNEDGSLVDSVNTAPIHVAGVTPSQGPYNTDLVKNVKPATATSSTLAYTESAAAQGLTTNVSTDGTIDFTDAEGTGYYRLVIWPESSDPTTVTNSTSTSQAPLLQYTAGDLFTSSGEMTALAESAGWTAASVVYDYDIVTPDAPVIDTPADGQATNNASAITISGTGTPGDSITLKLVAGDAITDTNAAGVTTIVEGDHSCHSSGCQVIVAADGTWTYTYVPSKPLADGNYTVVALQTEQDSTFNLTSDPSNPDADDPEEATSWGVTFTVDTVAPVAPTMTCTATPTDDPTPTISGGGVEKGATVRIYQDGTYVADATVDGTGWTYTPSDDLDNGSHRFTATQVDAAGNESVASPGCTVQVMIDVTVQGVKVVSPVQNAPSSITTPEASNWQITATAGDEVLVLSSSEGSEGSEPAKLDREVTYTIGERVSEDADTSADLTSYVTQGSPTCTDADDEPLSDDVFDASTGELRIGADDDIAEPITCTIVNQSAVASLVTKQIGGQSSAATTGWSLQVEPDASAPTVASGSTTASTFTLDAQTDATTALPSDYTLTATVPENLSLIAIQKLDLSDTACAALASAPLTAPDSCWVDLDTTVSSDGSKSATVEATAKDAMVQGTVNAYRITAIAPQDMPALPVTGGLGAWVFTLLGTAVLGVTALGVMVRRLFSRRRPRPSRT